MWPAAVDCGPPCKVQTIDPPFSTPGARDSGKVGTLPIATLPRSENPGPTISSRDSSTSTSTSIKGQAERLTLAWG